MKRVDAWMPFQDWHPYPPEAIVLVKNAYGERRIDQARFLWWGYEHEMGRISEGVITEAYRLDRPKLK